MGQGSIEYRCRRCGKVEASIGTPDVMISVIEVATYGRVKSIDGVPVHMVSSHLCADGGSGITDCIGGQEEGLRTKPPLLADGWMVVSWGRGSSAWVLCAVHEDEHGGTIGWWYRSDDTGAWDLLSSVTRDGFTPDRDPPLRET
jgi:hypothetical protein